MKDTIKSLNLDFGDFVPKAQYMPESDYLCYLSEDCAYRADRVDKYLTLLWAPDSMTRLVGIKLKGFLSVFRSVSGIIDSKAKSKSIPVSTLLKVLEALLEARIADGELERQAIERLRERYEKAIQFSESEDVIAPDEPCKELVNV
jgi:hypothetical protein